MFLIYFITSLLLIGLMMFLFCLGSPLRRIKENINSSDTKVTGAKEGKEIMIIKVFLMRKISLETILSTHTHTGTCTHKHSKLNIHSLKQAANHPEHRHRITIQIQKNFIIRNKCMKWKLAFLVTQIPHKKTNRPVSTTKVKAYK